MVDAAQIIIKRMNTIGYKIGPINWLGAGDV